MFSVIHRRKQEWIWVCDLWFEFSIVISDTLSMKATPMDVDNFHWSNHVKSRGIVFYFCIFYSCHSGAIQIALMYWPDEHTRSWLISDQTVIITLHLALEPGSWRLTLKDDVREDWTRLIWCQMGLCTLAQKNSRHTSAKKVAKALEGEKKPPRISFGRK